MRKTFENDENEKNILKHVNYDNDEILKTTKISFMFLCFLHDFLELFDTFFCTVQNTSVLGTGSGIK